MTIQNLGPMLAELQAVLHARGCKVTEMCVTLYSLDEGSMTAPETSPMRLNPGGTASWQDDDC
jgi:hypothetical protein